MALLALNLKYLGCPTFWFIDHASSFRWKSFSVWWWWKGKSRGDFDKFCDLKSENIFCKKRNKSIHQIQCMEVLSQGTYMICTGRITWRSAIHEGRMLYHRRSISGAWVWPRICLTDWQPWMTPSIRSISPSCIATLRMPWGKISLPPRWCNKPSICGGKIWMWRL